MQNLMAGNIFSTEKAEIGNKRAIQDPFLYRLKSLYKYYYENGLVPCICPA